MQRAVVTWEASCWAMRRDELTVEFGLFCWLGCTVHFYHKLLRRWFRDAP
eukprot:SAG31_NODE_41237_length_277_cov_0.584270_2_plen_49_part_01